MKLTDAKLRSLKATGKTQKFSDEGGLYLHLSPSGGKLWRLAYRFGGKQKTLALGQYPAVSLVEARKRREEARELLARGIDPGEAKKERKAAAAAAVLAQAMTYEVVAREWFAKHAPGWTASNRDRILARQERDVFPLLGSRPIREITAPDVLAVARRIEERGAVDSAHRAMQDCSRIFLYAVASGRADVDPVASLRGALSPIRSQSYASIREPQAIGALLRDIDAYKGNVIVRAALRLAPYVFVRPGELRKAEWAEIDLDRAEWRIPAEKMKMRVMHIVPLARQVVEQLRALALYSGGGRYLFPGMRSRTAPISDMTLLGGLRRLGYGKDEMTVHGFRSMASTLLNEQGYNRDWIERQLAHGERNSVRAAYNYAEYLPERRRMMQEWADYLDSLRDGEGA